MRRTGNHSTTCSTPLGKNTKLWRNSMYEHKWITRTTFSARGKFLKRLKYPVCRPNNVNTAPDKQVPCLWHVFKALLKIFLDRPVITNSSPVTHKTHKGVFEASSSWSAAEYHFTPAHLRVSLKLQSYHITALRHFLITYLSSRVCLNMSVTVWVTGLPIKPLWIEGKQRNCMLGVAPSSCGGGLQKKKKKDQTGLEEGVSGRMVVLLWSYKRYKHTHSDHVWTTSSLSDFSSKMTLTWSKPKQRSRKLFFSPNVHHYCCGDWKLLLS